MPDSRFQPNDDLYPQFGAVVLINASISTKTSLGRVIIEFLIEIGILFESEGGYDYYLFPSSR